MKIRKAVIPAAGFGTRFLPQTKAMPKEMLPVIDKPVIQYVVEEAISAGVQDIIIVTGWNKRAIEDHFDHNAELERLLDLTGKHKRLRQIQEIAELANFVYLRQKGPIGNATPLINARPVVGSESFFYLWGDDFFSANPPRVEQMSKAYKKFPGQILAAMRTREPEDTKKYGFAAGKEVAEGVLKVEQVIEKPGPSKAPSEFAIVSGCIFTPKIFWAIDQLGEPEAGRELVYTDALNVLLAEGEPVYAVEIKEGRYHDCGDVLKYLETVVTMGLEREEIKDELRKFIKEVI